VNSIMNDDLFGAWSARADGRAHYCLAGAPLCGSASPDTGQSLRSPGMTEGKLLLPWCPECHRLNVERWLAGGVLRREST
jgi:hypothetical protein